MPTVIRQNGFDVIIYTRDEHPPPHVHVFKAEGEAIINLGDEDEGPYLSEVYNMPRRDARNALDIIIEHQDFLRARWQEIWARRYGEEND